MRALQGTTRVAFLGFFASHIIFSFLVDAQGIFGALFPILLQDFLVWYTDLFQDPLMGNAQELLWFQSLIALELVFQVPFFFVACNFLSNTTLESYPRWFRYACIAYGAHTATSMGPILTTLAISDYDSEMARYQIFSVYLPYLIFPLWILTLAVTTDEKAKVP